MTDTVRTAPGSVTEGGANTALRLGWMVAECLGRLRPDGPAFGSPSRKDWTLPLDAADERSKTTAQIEATKVLVSIAGTANVAVPVDQLTGQDPVNFPTPNHEEPTAPYAFAYLVSRLLYARDNALDLHATLEVAALTGAEKEQPPDESTQWPKLAEFMWVWDAVIQDKLASGDFGTASAYQLGRGLAEAYWALNPKASSGDPQSWSYLLGPNRVTALSLLCRRLSASIGEITASAIVKSLQGWQAVAAAPGDYLEPQANLGDQLLVWRDLLLTQRDPTTLVPKEELEKTARRILPLLSAFKGELALGAGAAATLGVSAYFLPHIGGSIGAVLSAFGLTTAAVGSRAKATIQSVGDRVRASISQDAVNSAVVKLPNKATVPGILGMGSKARPPEPLLAALRP